MAAPYYQPSVDDDDMDLDHNNFVPSSPSSSSASHSDDLASIFTSSHADDNSTTPTSRNVSGHNQNLNNNLPTAGTHHTATIAANDQAYQQVISSLRERLSNLTIEAQRQLQDQPRQTQLALTAELREIYAEYARTGSQSRLSWSLWEFLMAREDMSTTGGIHGGELVFWSHEEAQDAKRAAQEFEEVEVDESNWETKSGSGNSFMGRSDDKSGFQDHNEHEETPKKKKSVREHPNRSFRINGEISLGVNLGSGGGAESSAIADTVMSTNDTDDQQHTPQTGDEPAATTNITFLNPQAVHSSISSSQPSSTNASSPPSFPTPPPSYTHDPPSTSLLRTLPFRPADIVFTFPSYTAFPGSPQTYLTHLNNIIKLHNSLANAILHHHSTKYLSPTLNTPTDTIRHEHGYVILRAGIAQLIRAKVTGMFQPPAENPYGLTPESESFLQEIFESKELGTAVTSGATTTSGLPGCALGFAEHGVAHHRMPVMSYDGKRVGWSPIPGPVVANRGVLGEVEEAFVGRLGRIPIQGVREWWAEKKEERMAVVGMRAFVAARECERGERSRAEGTYYGWEAWGAEEWGGGEGREEVRLASEDMGSVPLVDADDVIEWEGIERDIRG